MTNIVLTIARYSLWLMVVFFVLGGLMWGRGMVFFLAQAMETNLNNGQLIGGLLGVIFGLIFGSVICGFGLLQFAISDRLTEIRDLHRKASV